MVGGGRRMVGTRFCGQCGAEIPGVPGPCPKCGVVEWAVPPPPDATTTSKEARDIGHTRIALLLLAVGVVASLLPVGAIVGDALVLVGGILLIESANPFGGAHRRNAGLGLALAVAGGLAAFIVAVFFPLTVPPPPQYQSQLPGWIHSFESSFSFSFLLTVAFGAVSAFGLVLITYSLQDRVGRVCLWVAFGLALALGLAFYAVITQDLDALFNQAAAGNGLNAGLLSTLLTQANQFVYLQLIPNALFAGCFFLADTRIRSGAIPVAKPTSPDG